VRSLPDQAACVQKQKKSLRAAGLGVGKKEEKKTIIEQFYG
jgi:hypothetical protein